MGRVLKNLFKTHSSSLPCLFCGQFDSTSDVLLVPWLHKECRIPWLWESLVHVPQPKPISPFMNIKDGKPYTDTCDLRVRSHIRRGWVWKCDRNPCNPS